MSFVDRAEWELARDDILAGYPPGLRYINNRSRSLLGGRRPGRIATCKLSCMDLPIVARGMRPGSPPTWRR